MNTKKIASANQLTAVPRQGTKQGNNALVNGNYSTASTNVNNIDPDGDRDARKRAMILLKRKGYSNFQSPDWLTDNPEGKTETIEVKTKHPFKPPPFLGQGLSVRQVKLRTKLLESLDIRTVLLVIAPDTGKAYWQYLDVLEQGKHFDTRKKIRIYPIDNFEPLSDTLQSVRKPLKAKTGSVGGQGD
jgi:hypothetical protein